MKKHPRKIPDPPKPPVVPGVTQHTLGHLKEVQAELKSRRIEALRLYEPMPLQQAMHACMASERIVLGGNRCLAGEQEIYDPVANASRPVSEIAGAFHVLSLNPSGFIEVKRAEKPFIKAYDDLYEVTLSNGTQFRATLNHRLVSACGVWVTVRDAWQGQVPLCHIGDELELRQLLASGERTTLPLPAISQSPSSALSGTSEPIAPVKASVFRRRHVCERLRRLFSVSEKANAVRRRWLSPLLAGWMNCNRPLQLRSNQHVLPLGLAAQPPERGHSQRETNSDAVPSACLRDGLRWIGTVADWMVSYWTGHRQCDAPLLAVAGSAQEVSLSPNGAPGHNRKGWRMGGLGNASEHTRPCLWSRLLSSLGAGSRDGGLGAGPPRSSTAGASARRMGSHQTWWRFVRCSVSDPRTSRAPFPDQSQFDSSHPRWLNTDGCNSVTVAHLHYIRQDAVWDTYVPGNNNYLMGGLSHAQSGKSLSTFVEDARALTGTDPFRKYPERDGNLVIIGRNWPHIGLVCYPMLFKAGAFKIIKDLASGEWRAFRPGTDADRLAEAKPAPPLVPPRMVSEVSWVLKNAGYCQRVVLSNGWTVHFFSSEGEPPQGFQADLVHLDEDISNPSWVGEMQARLADRKGRLMWSAMPHSKNDALLGLCERADKEIEDGREPRTIEKFILRFLDNDHIDSTEKEKNIARWSALGVDELRMRAEGEFTQDSILMYPSFNPIIHTLPKDELPAGLVPPDWTRYVAIDPGHTVMACVFGAVPPDERFLLVYDELYLRNANALIWGEAFAAKCEGQHFYAFIMDMHGGTLRDLGSGRLPCELYSEQLRERGVRAQLTGHQFVPGSDDIQARTGLVRQMLHVRGDGTTRLRFLEGSVPELYREMKRYKKKVVQSNSGPFITDMPNTRGEVHAVQCCEYLCAYEPKYHQPPARPGPEPWWVRWLAERKKRQGEESGNFICLGPQRKKS